MLMYLASPFASAKLERKSFARTVGKKTRDEELNQQIKEVERGGGKYLYLCRRRGFSW